MKRRTLLLLFCLLGAMGWAQEGYRLVGYRFSSGSGAVSIPSTQFVVSWQAGGIALPEMKDGEGKLLFAGLPLLALPVLLDPGVTPPPPPTPTPDPTPAPEPNPTSVGTEGASVVALALSPNPASSEVRVMWTAGVFPRGSRLELYSAMGQLLLSALPEGDGAFSLDVASLRAGVYVVRLVSEEGLALGVGRLLVVR